MTQLTIQLLEHSLHGTRASSAAHGDIELVLMFSHCFLGGVGAIDKVRYAGYVGSGWRGCWRMVREWFLSSGERVKHVVLVGLKRR